LALHRAQSRVYVSSGDRLEKLGNPERPTRQEVYYSGTPAGPSRYAPDRFPVWIDFGERIFYGLANLDGGGVKIAADPRGAAFDPSSAERTPTAESLARARALIAERFPELAKAPLLKAEVCQYENSPDGHLLIDRHPEAGNVWLVGGGSGHGFKLSPAVGEIVASAIASGKQVPEVFRFGRRREAKASTQFEVGTND
jgi:glycine/D-amino acid oxidase-like deaminating enzyme